MVQTISDRKGSSDKLKGFFKHVLLASKRHEDHKKAKEDLKKQIIKVKSVALTNPKKDILQLELEKLEQKLNEVLEKEGKILVATKRDDLVTESLKAEIKILENKVNDLRNVDLNILNKLKDDIENLEYQLSIKDTESRAQDNIKKNEMENINKALVDLRERIKFQIEKENERELRFQEIEQKIKNRVGKNYTEIIKIEKQLIQMEERYDKIKSEGKYDKSMLQEVEEKIHLLRQKLLMRKAGMTEEQERFVPEVKIERSHLFRKKIIPKRRLFGRHDIRIEPVKSGPEEKTEFEKKSETLPELPPLPTMLPKYEKPKKQGLLTKLFHKKYDSKKEHELPMFSEPEELPEMPKASSLSKLNKKEPEMMHPAPEELPPIPVPPSPPKESKKEDISLPPLHSFTDYDFKGLPDIPLPPPEANKKKGFFSGLFGKKKKKEEIY